MQKKCMHAVGGLQCFCYYYTAMHVSFASEQASGQQKAFHMQCTG